MLADDHPILLHGLRDLIDAETDFSVIEATSNGPRAMHLVRTRKPHIALLDVSIPDVGGMEILRDVKRSRSPVRVIFLTATLVGNQIADAIAMGVWGLLRKEDAPDKLLDCMRSVAAGSRWLPKSMLDEARRPHSPSVAQLFQSLSPREREISGLVGEGRSNRDIAELLGISVGTIGIHLHSVYQKLQISNRIALYALQAELQLTKDRLW